MKRRDMCAEFWIKLNLYKLKPCPKSKEDKNSIILVIGKTYFIDKHYDVKSRMTAVVINSLLMQ